MGSGRGQQRRAQGFLQKAQKAGAVIASPPFKTGDLVRHKQNGAIRRVKKLETPVMTGTNKRTGIREALYSFLVESPEGFGTSYSAESLELVIDTTVTEKWEQERRKHLAERQLTTRVEQIDGDDLQKVSF